MAFSRAALTSFLALSLAEPGRAQAQEANEDSGALRVSLFQERHGELRLRGGLSFGVLPLGEGEFAQIVSAELAAALGELSLRVSLGEELASTSADENITSLALGLGLGASAQLALGARLGAEQAGDIRFSLAFQ